jgi:hypothetical protein
VPVIVEPVAGTFSEAFEIRVVGSIPTSDLPSTVATLDGTSLALSAGAALPGGLVEAIFDVSVGLDFVKVFNPLLLEWTLPGGASGRERVTVVAGAFTPDGVASPLSAALRFTDSGLDAFEPAVEALVAFDLEEVLPVGRRIYNKCLVDTFAGCIGRAKVYVDDPPPSFGSQRVALDALAGGVQLDLVLAELRVDLDIRGSGLVPDCRLRLTADAAEIGAHYALAPDAPDLGGPTRVDLTQIGSLALDFDRFRQKFTGGSCNDGLIEDVVDAIVGDLEDDILDALEELLEDPDGTGPDDGPLADAIEDALADVELAAPLGEALEVVLKSPLAGVIADETGVTFVTDTVVQALIGDAGCDAPAGVPDLTASLEPESPLPVLGELTPNGGLPFDVALALNDAALHQGLKAFTECGLLHSDLEELELGGTSFAITAGLLAVIEPAFRSLPDSLPLTIRVRPMLAPILGAGAGPRGELAALRIADLRVAVIDPLDDFEWLALAVDATTGLDFRSDPTTEGLALGTAGALADVEIVVLGNAIGAEEAPLKDALARLLEDGSISLADELGHFRLPSFLGLALSPIEIVRDTGSATFFFEAIPAPEPRFGTLGAAGLAVVAALVRRQKRARSG